MFRPAEKGNGQWDERHLRDIPKSATKKAIRDAIDRGAAHNPVMRGRTERRSFPRGQVLPGAAILRTVGDNSIDHIEYHSADSRLTQPDDDTPPPPHPSVNAGSVNRAQHCLRADVD